MTRPNHRLPCRRPEQPNRRCFDHRCCRLSISFFFPSRLFPCTALLVAGCPRWTRAHNGGLRTTVLHSLLLPAPPRPAGVADHHHRLLVKCGDCCSPRRAEGGSSELPAQGCVLTRDLRVNLFSRRRGERFRVNTLAARLLGGRPSAALTIPVFTTRR